MKYIKRLTTACCAALLMVMLASCEGADLYDVLAPEWLQDRINEAAGSEEEDNAIDFVPNPSELGATDNSTTFLALQTDNQKIEPGETYRVKFTNYGGNTNYNNFIIILRNGIPNGQEGYYEYGVFRADNWCWNTTYTDGAQSDNFCTKKIENDSRDWTAWLAAMSKAKCTATITNKGDGTAEIGIIMIGADGVTYKQNYVDIQGIDANDLYFSFSLEKSHLVFGDVPETDAEPASMTLSNVPNELTLGESFEEVFANMTAEVTFEDGVTKTVNASDLIFEAVPDVTTVGEKVLVAIYNKTYQGETAAKPVTAYAKFNVMLKVTGLEVTAQPTRNTYYFYTTEATSSMTDRTLAFDPTGLEVTATYSDGSKGVVNNKNLTFSTIPAKVGSHTVTITGSNEQTTTVNVNVKASTVSTASVTPKTLGTTDNSADFFGYQTDNVKVDAGKTIKVNFTNYAGGSNWNNWLIILRQASGNEYAVVRADNWGWRYEINPVPGARYSGGQADWTAWLAAMNGATCTAYVTNCNNGTADIQVIMNGTDGKKYYQYYLGTSDIIVDDLNLAFTVDHCHLVFE